MEGMDTHMYVVYPQNDSSEAEWLTAMLPKLNQALEHGATLKRTQRLFKGDIVAPVGERNPLATDAYLLIFTTEKATFRQMAEELMKTMPPGGSVSENDPRQ